MIHKPSNRYISNLRRITHTKMTNSSNIKYMKQKTDYGNHSSNIKYMESILANRIIQVIIMFIKDRIIQVLIIKHGLIILLKDKILLKITLRKMSIISSMLSSR
jgi:hypothetical protein